MYEIILLLVMNNEPTFTKAPSGQKFATQEECQAQIGAETLKAQMIIDTDLRLPKGQLTVRAAKCFSEEELQKMRGEQSAKEHSVRIS